MNCTKKLVALTIAFLAAGTALYASHKEDPNYFNVTRANCPDDALYQQSVESGLDLCHAPAAQ